jgi:hypothetical protein
VYRYRKPILDNLSDIDIENLYSPVKFVQFAKQISFSKTINCRACQIANLDLGGMAQII